jgi:hypothetical protein
MNASAWLTAVGIFVAVAGPAAGGIIRRLLTRLDVAEALVASKQQTIDTLERQIDRLEITAQIQDKFFSSLPRTPDPGPTPKSHRGTT